MASYVLYPPIVDGYMPSFVAGNNSYCRVYFSLSKFNSEADFENVQVSITKQTTGEKCVASFDDAESSIPRIYRMAGILLNVPFTAVSGEENLYYIDIENKNLNTTDGSYSGWCPGWIYKIQLRLSKVTYTSEESSSVGQSTWLTEHGSDFSEWSTICTVKPIGQPEIIFTSIKGIDGNGYQSRHLSSDYTIYGFEFIGEYKCEEDKTENLYNYRIKIYDGITLLDDSGYLYADQNFDNQKIDYISGIEDFDAEKTYTIVFEYHTINDYTETLTINAKGTANTQNSTDIEIMTLDTSYDIYSGRKVYDPRVTAHFISVVSEFDECEDGRIGYFLCGNEQIDTSKTGIYYVRRTDSRSNFTKWVDIKKLDFRDRISGGILELEDLYYDYTVESGVFYRYGIQAVDSDENRGKLMKMRIGGDVVNYNVQTIRDFSYAYLVGQEEQQLRLAYNDSISSYKLTVTDSTSVTLGGVYPFINRNGNNKYKVLSISGIISFNSDENKIFLQDEQLYEYSEVAQLYADRDMGKYDHTHEREYRNKVIAFLTDGKPKLYKSFAEGNILVRLTDVSCSPANNLGRLIYNFNATATEIGEPTIKNYLKYKITSLEDVGNNAPPIHEIGKHTHIDADTHTIRL